MKVPDITGPTVGMRDIPTVSSGPMATADHFGGGQARQTQALGNAIQGAGMTLVAEAQKRQRIENEALITSSINKAHIAVKEQRQALYEQYKGEKAIDAPAAMEGLLGNLRTGIEKNLRTREQKQMFEQAWSSLARQTQTDALSYRDQEVLKFRNLELDAQNLLLGQEAMDNAAGALTPDGKIANRARLAIRHENIRKRLEGGPQEAIELALRESDRKFHGDLLAAMEPKNALEYLKQDDVRTALGPAEWKKWRDAAEKVVSSVDARYAAVKAVDDGMTSDQAYRESLKLPKEQAAAFMAEYDNYSKRVDSERKETAANTKAAVIDSFVSANYTIEAMNPEERAALMRDPEALKEVNGLRKIMEDMGKLGKDAVPNYSELDKIRAMDRDAINEWIAEPGNYSKLLIWDAGRNTAELKEILDKRMGKASGGGSGGANDLNIDEMATQGFKFYANEKYDSKNEEHKRMVSNFRAIYNYRKGWLRKKEGRALDFSEQSDLYFKLRREVRDNKDMLDAPLADGDPLTAFENASKRIDSVNPETGKKEATFAPEAEGGEPETFEVVPEVSLLAYNVPDAKEGYVAKTSGERFGVTYNAGDSILFTKDPRTGKQDGVVVIDKNYDVKDGLVGNASVGSVEELTAARARPVPTPAPAKSSKMKAWEKDNKAEFVWQKYANRWVAMIPDPNDHRRKVGVESNPEGSIIFGVPFGMPVTDADFLPEADSEPSESPKAAGILRKIERLEAEVADMDRDPRTNQAVAHDKREEIKRLREEYDRVSGKNARESRYYNG